MAQKGKSKPSSGAVSKSKSTSKPKSKPTAKSAAKSSSGRKVVSTNRRAGFDFHLLEKYELGLELKGSEVKSLRDAKVEIAEAYGRVTDGELWLVSMHIPAYGPSGASGHEPGRNKKLLARQKEIAQIKQRLDQERLTFIPTAVYFRRGIAKVEMALAKRKLKQDKRADMAEAESKKRAMRQVRRSTARGKQALEN